MSEAAQCLEHFLSPQRAVLDTLQSITRYITSSLQRTYSYKNKTPTVYQALNVFLTGLTVTSVLIIFGKTLHFTLTGTGSSLCCLCAAPPPTAKKKMLKAASHREKKKIGI